MKLGLSIVIDGEIDSLLSDNLKNLEREYLRGNRHFKKIEVLTTGTSTNSKIAGKQTASFFSGGLDSFYTATTEPTVQSIICIWGFDIPLQNIASWNQLNEVAVNFAKRHGHELTTIKTNLKTLSHGRLLWGRHYFGWALSGVAQSLRPNFDVVLIPGDGEAYFADWGSNGNLNALCSTSKVTLREHGTASRVRKIVAIDQIDSLTEMRVCLKAGFKFLNCGECKKCHRTRLELDGANSSTRPLGLEEGIEIRSFALKRISKTEYSILKEDQLEIARIGTPGFSSLARHLRQGRARDMICQVLNFMPKKMAHLLHSAEQGFKEKT